MKSTRHRNRYRWLIILTCSAVLLVILIGASFSIYVENEIEENINSLNGKISSIRVNLFARSIKVKDLEWSSKPTSTNLNPHFLRLSAVTAEGINLYELFFNKALVINEVTIDSGVVHYTRNVKRSGHKTGSSNYKHFLFKGISLNHIQTHIKTDTIDSFSAIINGHLRDASIAIDSLNNLSYSIESVDALAEKISVSRKEGMYGGTIARVHVNTRESKIRIDSAELIPNFGKYEFAQHLGKQTARINLSIPQLTIDGFRLDRLLDSTFVASKIEINSFHLVAFKDKRIPFLRKENVPLPMASFSRLPFDIKVDSVVISNSLITIEEFPEHGIHTGIITFENIDASIAGLDNREKEKDHRYATLRASALLMGTGKIKALFQLPLDGTSVYTAHGSISNMTFKELNPILIPMANVRVESGYLKDLRFDFNYNEYTSKGTINVDYRDLQIISLNTNKRSTNEIKTFFMNVFVKNERSKSLTPQQKNGVIDIERDRKRYIFNVWWKSILDGLKSTILG